MKNSLLICAMMLAFGLSQQLYVNNNEQVRLAPRMLNYQGYLTDTLGIPITNPSLSMTFAIFDAVSSGNQKWTETQSAVSVNKGIFSVLLGTVAMIPDSVFNNTDRWLELAVGGQTLSPRTRIVSTAYAYTATYSDTAQYSRNAAPDNDWNLRVTDIADTTLQLGGRWGMTRAGNVMYGTADSTHVNFGVSCTTGTSGPTYKYCTVSGGYCNAADYPAATVGGGESNRANSTYTTVSGGYRNTASGYISTVGGGYNNAASNAYSTIGGGCNNIASNSYTTVAGGVNNTASFNYATVGGGYDNMANSDNASVGGGFRNYIAGSYSAITGGYADTITASGDYSYLFGINSNLTQDSTFMVDMPHIRFGTEAGGYEFPTTDGSGGQVMVTNGGGQLSWGANSDVDWTFRITDTADTTLQMGGKWGIARSGNVLFGNADSTHVNFGVSCTTGTSGLTYKYCTVAGGYDNDATEDGSTVGGGWLNTADGYGATVGGGRSNTANYDYATVGGGYSNTASVDYANVGGGDNNTASGYGATVGGGHADTANGDYSTIGGGYYNKARAVFSAALSGRTNYAGADLADSCAVVSGGRANYAREKYSSVGGGYSNAANGSWSTIGGGTSNMTSVDYATVGGGGDNLAGYYYATVGGGYYNIADGFGATVGGGYAATANGDYATVGGGYDNNASGSYATVGGGAADTASGEHSTVGGGYDNTASGDYATVGCGYDNTASGSYATVGGGRSNTASGSYATVGSGYRDSSSANYSFTTGNNSSVPAGYDNSAAFNGQTATAMGQTRVGALSKVSGTFTIDHPLDPENRILNHYFVESPEMVLIYRGSVTLDAEGKAFVNLPDYFSSLNKNPMIQLTGVKSNDVWVEEEVSENTFVIGGKPGIKVFWTVTGERKDPSAEITKIIMPVEQVKEGGLAGRSLDDEFLVVTMEQLEKMGKADGFKFRHASSQQRYQEMKKHIESIE